jgi:hypothetical protein
MAKQDAAKKDGSSLEQAQYEYRKTIYFAGLKILETFSEAVIGQAPSGAQASGAPPGMHIYGGQPMGPPIGWHINIYGAPPGWHINGPPPPPCGPVTDAAPPGWHINAIIKLVEVVLSLQPPGKPPK